MPSNNKAPAQCPQKQKHHPTTLQKQQKPKKPTPSPLQQKLNAILKRVTGETLPSLREYQDQEAQAQDPDAINKEVYDDEDDVSSVYSDNEDQEAEDERDLAYSNAEGKAIPAQHDTLYAELAKLNPYTCTYGNATKSEATTKPEAPIKQESQAPINSKETPKQQQDPEDDEDEKLSAEFEALHEAIIADGVATLKALRERLAMPIPTQY